MKNKKKCKTWQWLVTRQKDSVANNHVTRHPVLKCASGVMSFYGYTHEMGSCFHLSHFIYSARVRAWYEPRTACSKWLCVLLSALLFSSESIRRVSCLLLKFCVFRFSGKRSDCGRSLYSSCGSSGGSDPFSALTLWDVGGKQQQQPKRLGLAAE